MSIADWASLHGNHFLDTRVMVTGGAGFIGSHLVEALLALGANVVVIDDLSGGDEANLAPFQEQYGDKLDFKIGSILDEPLLARLVDGCQYIFHQAALGSVPRSVEQPQQYAQVNFTGTVNVLETARQAGVERVTFAASSSAYGETPTLPKIESMAPDCRSPYAATKLACEAMMSAYACCYELDTVSLRYFNIFGPRQNANSAYAAVIAAFAKALIEQDTNPMIFGDGEQSRDFTYVDNAVHANLLAARAEGRLGGPVMNIACAGRITVNELAVQMAEGLGKPHLTPKHGPERAGDVKHSLADLTRAKEIIGYEPVVDFATGLRKTVDWYAQVMG